MQLNTFLINYAVTHIYLTGDDYNSSSTETKISQLLACSHLQLMDAIRRLHKTIEEKINFETLIPFLNKYKIFTTGEMKYFVNKLHSDADKVANLVIWLEAKNEKGIYDFVRALNEAKEHSGHIVILEHLPS